MRSLLLDTPPRAVDSSDEPPRDEPHGDEPRTTVKSSSTCIPNANTTAAAAASSWRTGLYPLRRLFFWLLIASVAGCKVLYAGVVWYRTMAELTVNPTNKGSGVSVAWLPPPPSPPPPVLRLGSPSPPQGRRLQTIVGGPLVPPSSPPPSPPPLSHGLRSTLPSSALPLLTVPSKADWTALHTCLDGGQGFPWNTGAAVANNGLVVFATAKVSKSYIGTFKPVTKAYVCQPITTGGPTPGGSGTEATTEKTFRRQWLQDSLAWALAVAFYLWLSYLLVSGHRGIRIGRPVATQSAAKGRSHTKKLRAPVRTDALLETKVRASPCTNAYCTPVASPCKMSRPAVPPFAPHALLRSPWYLHRLQSACRRGARHQTYLQARASGCCSWPLAAERHSQALTHPSPPAPSPSFESSRAPQPWVPRSSSRL